MLHVCFIGQFSSPSTFAWDSIKFFNDNLQSINDEDYQESIELTLMLQSQRNKAVKVVLSIKELIKGL